MLSNKHGIYVCDQICDKIKKNNIAMILLGYSYVYPIRDILQNTKPGMRNSN